MLGIVIDSNTTSTISQPLPYHSRLWFLGTNSWQLFFFYCWLFGLSSWSSCLGDSRDVIGLSAEEQDNEESEKRRKKKKGTKRKRDGRGPEEGTLAYDLKLDDMLDRTLEDGAKQHNLTAVNVRNILHVSNKMGWCVIRMEVFHGKQWKILRKFLTLGMWLLILWVNCGKTFYISR